MAVLELYGKCREIGYCDCAGLNGCVDEEKPLRAPRDAKELKKLAGKRRHTHPSWLENIIEL